MALWVLGLRGTTETFPNGFVNHTTNFTLIQYGSAALFMAVLLTIFVVVISRREVEVQIDRVIFRRGLLTKQQLEIEVRKIEGVDVIHSRPLVGPRVSSVVVRGTGGTKRATGALDSAVELADEIRALLGKGSSASSGEGVTDIAATKNCPMCGEVVLAVALKCKHCGEMLSQ